MADDGDDFFDDLYENEEEPQKAEAPAAEPAVEPPAQPAVSVAPEATEPALSSEPAQQPPPPQSHEDRVPVVANGQSTPIQAQPPMQQPDLETSRTRMDDPRFPATVGIKEDGKMFIGGLNWETTDDSLRKYFEQFGEVVECTVMRDGNSGRSRGFGFLTFKDPKCVNTVMVKEHFLDGKIIDPKRAIPRDEQEKTAKIFVGGVSQDATEQIFTDYFSQFGRVIDATLMMDKDTGRPRGFGFVTFEGDHAVDACLAQPLDILGKPIEVKRAQPRGNVREEEDGSGRFGRGRGRGDRFGQDSAGGGFNGDGGGQNMSGVSPAAMARMMQQMQGMQQMWSMMQMGGMNPAMMQQMQANPAMMQQMQQMQAMQQARMQQMGAQQGNQQMMGAGMHNMQGSPGPGAGRGQGFSPQQQQGYEYNKMEDQMRRGAGSSTPSSWDGMYDGAPQPPTGPSGRGRGRSTPQPPSQGQAPLNAPTGPKNPGRGGGGGSYRGGGRGHQRGFHPYARP